jgi:hypothetical protein
MAFAAVNFTNPVVATNLCTGQTQQLADQVIGGLAVIDFGAAVYRAAKLQVYIKTLTALVATDVAVFTLQVGTGAALTLPVNIIQKSITMATGDASLQFVMHGISQTLFRSCKLTVTSTGSHAFTYDAIIDVA